MDGRLKRVGILLFEGSDLLDFAGPTSAFYSAARHLVRTGQADRLLYEIELLSIDGGMVRTLQGVSVETRAAPELRPRDFDTIIVTGGLADHRTCDPRLIEWVSRNHDKPRRMSSVCCGAFILAGAGVLDGHPATTHWEDCAFLQQSFPKVEVRPDCIYVQDGNLWTAAGISSGIDMSLAMIEEDHGHALALLVARNLVVFLKRPGGQSQFSAPLQSQTAEGPLASLLGWIVENPCEDLRTETLADRANMSLRNFYRAFEAATGTSPAEWVESSRVEIAKRLLEQTSERIEQVAYKSGHPSYESMRKAFAKRLGVSPAAYRSRFARSRSTLEEPPAMPAFYESYVLGVQATETVQ
jgi:transcriptional regulator GlxA family with amidase domain